MVAHWTRRFLYVTYIMHLVDVYSSMFMGVCYICINKYLVYANQTLQHTCVHVCQDTQFIRSYILGPSITYFYLTTPD